MKNTLMAFSLFVACINGLAQGQVNFNTHLLSANPPIDFRVMLPGFPNPEFATAGFGELVIYNGNSFTPLSPAAAFGAGAEAGYLSGGIATAPAGFPGGTTVNMFLRAWLGGAGSTYDSAAWKIQSFPFTVRLEESPNALNDLNGLGTGVLVLIPEPTTFVFGSLGLAGFLLLKRRR